MNILIINKQNNLGDTMCQMRGIKEYKDRHPDYTFTFYTTEYLHLLAANHTDLFTETRFIASFPEIVQYKLNYKEYGFDEVIEFAIDWGAALDHGILKAWTEKTLNFTPSTDKPYWIVRPEEDTIAKKHAEKLRKQFDRLCLVQLEAPSGYVRSFRYEDWEKVLDCIPKEVGIVYPGPLDLAYNNRLKHRENLVLLPGYDVGVNVALIPYIDFCVITHGGMAMMAHVVDKKEVVHAIFTEAGSPNILWVPEWDNLVYPTHKDVNWSELKEAIMKHVP